MPYTLRTGRMSRGLLALALLLLVGLVPARAEARSGWEAPRPGPLPGSFPVTPHDDVDDAVRASAAGVRRLRARASVAVRYASDGTPIRVEVSPSYAPDPAAEQALVDFLAGRLHGAELTRLTVLVATPAEIEAECGQGVLGCYAPSLSTMLVPGEDTPGAEPKEFVVTHELGHHVATHRSNAPWTAADTGPKRWASYERVCEGLAGGELGTGYLDDPSEGFAQSYALLHYREAAFGYSPLLTPDAGSFEAIEADVREPWTGPKRRTLTGRVSRRGARRYRSFRVATGLDGSSTFALRGPRGTDLDIWVMDGRRILAQNLQRGSGGFVKARVCGQSAVTVVVGSYRGAGRFRVTARVP